MSADDIAEISRLLQLYCFYTDSGDADRWSGLFTEDATFDTGAGVVANGRSQLKDFMSGRIPASFHFAAAPVVDVAADGRSATATSYVTVFDRPSLGAKLLAVYHDDLRRTPEGWRIRSRRLEPLSRREQGQ